MGKLTSIEWERIKELCDYFQDTEFYALGLKWHSGGFVQAEYRSYSDDWIYIDLEWGIHNECENTLHIEEWQIPRFDLNVKSWSVSKALRALV